MKRNIILAVASLLMVAACADKSQADSNIGDNSNSMTLNDGTTQFRSQKGDLVAIRTIKGSDTTWAFQNALGEDLIPNTDSIWVIADSATGKPREAIVHHDGRQTMLAFWSNKEENLERMAEGDLKDGQRDGLWIAYDFHTGKKMSETHYVDGVEHGDYTVFNENGTPSITGQNKNGKRTGKWSFYDKEGKLVGTKKF